MRKLFLLVIAALAMTAFAAAPASADRLDPNPSFPHQDYDPANWVAVSVTDASSGDPCHNNDEPWAAGNCFFGETFTWSAEVGYQPMNSWYSMGGCSASLDAHFNNDGSTEVASGTDGCFSGVPFYVGQYPWSGQTCLHIPTGEAWLRQGVNLYQPSGPTWPGEMFGEIHGGTNPHVDFSGATINNDASTSAQVRNLTAEFPLDAELGIEGRIDDNSDNVPCSWPEVTN